MLEKMNEFFNRRLDGYEEHQLNAIACAKEFYPLSARQLPMEENARILDLGCGTGLELGYYFPLNPTARLTCIDLAEDLLQVLQTKFADRALTVIQGSYFDVPFEEAYYDAVISVESLHHFTGEEKLPLYQKIHAALTAGGYFLLTDYFAPSEQAELFFRRELLRLKAEQGITDDGFYHYDTPLTAEHETKVLQAAGFSRIERIGQWENTYMLKAYKAE